MRFARLVGSWRHFDKSRHQRPLSAETRLQACALRAEVSRPALKVRFLRSLPSDQQSEDQTRPNLHKPPVLFDPNSG